MQAIAGPQARTTNGQKAVLLHFDAHTDAYHNLDHFLGAYKSAAHWASYLVRDGHVDATRSVQDIIAAKPDCVLYMQEGYDPDDLCALLAAGINVITTRGEFFNPKKMDADLRERIEGACREGGASLHATGSSPGFITEAVPLSPNKNVGYWGGWGGSTAIVDQDARMCISYVMNRMESSLLGDTRGFGITQAAYASLAG